VSVVIIAGSGGIVWGFVAFCLFKGRELLVVKVIFGLFGAGLQGNFENLSVLVPLGVL